ncbi:MAG: hypothetical protein ATN33_05920 [Epulopiscium sp. Nele67-Bin001]|nr:MAG: hypothetical protein ATN33_05920 [Epulopiscium sp. Nele67-Bin001]
MSMPTIPDMCPTIDINTEDTLNLLLCSISVQEQAISSLFDAETEKLKELVCRYKACLISYEELQQAYKHTEGIIESLMMKEWLLSTKINKVMELQEKLGACGCKLDKSACGCKLDHSVCSCKDSKNKSACGCNSKDSKNKSACGCNSKDSKNNLSCGCKNSKDNLSCECKLNQSACDCGSCTCDCHNPKQNNCNENNSNEINGNVPPLYSYSHSPNSAYNYYDITIF